jgi:hypothetical protein
VNRRSVSKVSSEYGWSPIDSRSSPSSSRLMMNSASPLTYRPRHSCGQAGRPACRQATRSCQRFTAPGTRTARGCPAGRAGTRVWIMRRQIPPVQGAEPCTPGLERGLPQAGAGGKPLPPRREPAAAEGARPFASRTVMAACGAAFMPCALSARRAAVFPARPRGPGAQARAGPGLRPCPQPYLVPRAPPARFTPALLTGHLFMRCPEASLRPPGNPGAGISIVNSRAVPGELFMPRSAR